jgi:hypothetical protein
LLGYPYTYNLSDSNNTNKLITKNDIEKEKEKVNKLKNFISNLELKRISESKAVIC